jgi:hypothetical protein
MRGQMKTKQHSVKIVNAKFVPMEILIKESPKAKKNKKRKGNQVPIIPNNPIIKTNITNQLRMNSKELFNPSLKDPQPIIIEDEDNSRFSNMEEMAVHTLKKMTGDKEKLKFSKGETSGVQFATIKMEYPADSGLQQNEREFGPDIEQDSDGISPNTRLPSKHI